ncbi:hypothetical protein AB4Y64_17690 [Lysobacter sp. TAF61]|uniref:hypothetical protein n=1 Tax=Lysobacter sp. TAF61 TaxID=3233072 RepID=UPI003F9AB3F8
MKVIAEEPWAWMLFSNEDGALFLTAMCGSVGLYSVDFQLTEDEAASFSATGRSALEALARDVSYHPSKYQGRHIANFTDAPGIKGAVSGWRSQRAAP